MGQGKSEGNKSLINFIRVLNLMNFHTVKPTVVAYNSLISMYARAQDSAKVDSIYARLKREATPDLVTFSIMLDFYRRTERLHDMGKILLLMVEMGFTPTFSKYPYNNASSPSTPPPL